MSQRIQAVLLLSLLLSACVSRSAREPHTADSLTVMTYNVENLFDTKQDADREDYTFLPLAIKNTPQHRLNCSKLGFRQSECRETDWNESVLNRKLEQLADVILSVNGGRGPDVMILDEVENLNVLNMLNEKLGKAKFATVVLVEGPDVRGIDVGMMSRFPLVKSAVLHPINFAPKTEEDKIWMARSRNILHSTFKLPNNDILNVFGVHFPSQHNPTYWREQAIDFLNGLMSKLPKGELAIAGGDFNISSEEDARFNLFRDRLQQKWLVSHYIGCGQCVGTHNYRGSWSFLDALLFQPSMGPNGDSKWQVVPKSIHVFKESRFQTSQYMTPARFDERKPVGVSDHYPMIAEIVLRQNSVR